MKKVMLAEIKRREAQGVKQDRDLTSHSLPLQPLRLSLGRTLLSAYHAIDTDNGDRSATEDAPGNRRLQSDMQCKQDRIRNQSIRSPTQMI